MSLRLRKGLLRAAKRSLLHVLPAGRVCSMTCWPAELMMEWGQDYQHTVIVPCSPFSADSALIRYLQLSGARILFLEAEGGGAPDMAALDPDEFSAALFYDNRPTVDLGLPTIHYAYSATRTAGAPDVVVAPTQYAAEALGVRADFIVPPGIQSRKLRVLNQRVGGLRQHTVGVFSSGYGGRAPSALVRYLDQALPPTVGILAIGTDATTHGRCQVLPGMPGAFIYGCRMSDVLVYAHAPEYTPLYGRQFFELMGSGVPVICERRGWPAVACAEKGSALFYETQEELPECISRLRSDPSRALQLGANAQALAGWEDITIHLGSLKRILYAMGA